MRKFLLAIVMLSLLAPITANAASPVTPGLTISPAIEQLNLKKGQKSIGFESQVTNNTHSQMVVNISTTDFTALNETGGIVFLPNLTNRPHGLAQWLKPSENQVVLPVGSTKTIPVIIAPDANLAAGGHYGALVYRVLTPGTAAKGNLITSNEEVSSLVFLTTATGGSQSVGLDTQSLSNVLLKIPASIDLVLINTGNTQIAPSGLVIIVNSSNKEVARGNINLDSGLILPGTSRLYTVALHSETTTFPGSYHLVVAYQANGSAKILVYSTSFLLINEQILVIAMLCALAVVILLLRRVGPGIVYRLRKP